MELLDAEPAIDLYDAVWPIHTAAQASAPARVADDEGRHTVANSLLSCGTRIGHSSVTRSVLSTGARVSDGCLLDEVVLLPGARIGAGCRLRRAIVDSNVEVPDGTVIGYSAPGTGDCVPTVARIALVTGDETEPKYFRSVA